MSDIQNMKNWNVTHISSVILIVGASWFKKFFYFNITSNQNGPMTPEEKMNVALCIQISHDERNIWKSKTMQLLNMKHKLFSSFENGFKVKAYKIIKLITGTYFQFLHVRGLIWGTTTDHKRALYYRLKFAEYCLQGFYWNCSKRFLHWMN